MKTSLAQFESQVEFLPEEVLAEAGIPQTQLCGISNQSLKLHK
jgi:hypothetical protein